jgi:hypothetical protein
MSNDNNTRPTLSQEQAMQLAQSYARFEFLRNATIKQPKDDAELRGLTEFMARTFIDHASEFIGCWFGVKNEYEPMLNIFAQMFNRVTGIQAQHAALVQAQRAQQVGAPAPVEESKIIPIGG